MKRTIKQVRETLFGTIGTAILLSALVGCVTTSDPVNPMAHCHRPLVVTDRETRLSRILGQLQTEPGDDIIKQDVILVWGAEKRIITGTDLLGYLMRGIAKQKV